MSVLINQSKCLNMFLFNTFHLLLTWKKEKWFEVQKKLKMLAKEDAPKKLKDLIKVCLKILPDIFQLMHCGILHMFVQ